MLSSTLRFILKRSRLHRNAASPLKSSTPFLQSLRFQSSNPRKSNQQNHCVHRHSFIFPPPFPRTLSTSTKPPIIGTSSNTDTDRTTVTTPDVPSSERIRKCHVSIPNLADIKPIDVEGTLNPSNCESTKTTPSSMNSIPSISSVPSNTFNTSNPSSPSSTKMEVTQREMLSVLIKHAWPNTPELRTRSLIAIALMVSSKLVVVSIPFWYKSIVDAMTITAADPQSLPLNTIPIALVAGYGTSRALASIFREAQGAVFANVTLNGTKKIAVRLFDHLHSLDLDFHKNRQTGLLSKAIDRGIRAVTYICNTTLINVIPTAVEFGLVAGILGMQFEDKSFLLCTTTTVGVYVLWSVAVTQYRTKLRQRMNKLDNQSSAHIIDSLINYETVKYFNNERVESMKYGDIMNQYASAAIKVSSSLSVLNAGQNVIFTTGLAVMLYLACQGISAGTMTVGDLVLVNTLLFQLSVPLNFIGSVYREVKLALTDLETMMKITHTRSAVRDDPVKKPSELVLDNGPDIEFRNVSFGYDMDIMDQRTVIKDCSFKITGGQKIAIVGGSGSGKSTILRLLYRFYDPQHGDILVNGQKTDEITIQSLREQIGIVPQDIVLFNDTLYNNIAYGAGRKHEDITMDDVVNVCKTAQLHDFVMTLPEQYDTVVGERGLKLSGGEKQRVAISRMLLKECKIIIMDEPTSSLDSATESDILTTMDHICNEGCLPCCSRPTTLVIAHRLSTITDSDCILVFDNGVVVEQGTHQELLTNPNGYYRNLWEFQSMIVSDSED